MRGILLLTLLSICSCAAIEETYNHFKTPEITQETPHPVVDEYEQMKIYSRDYPISKELSNVEYVSNFKKIVCPNLIASECDEKFARMVHERLYSEYKVSTVENSMKWCSAYPIECKDIKNIEIYYILSWNQYVDKIKERGWKPTIYPSLGVMDKR